MIIDDDYCQYDTFRIINKADKDAIAQFEIDVQDLKSSEAKQEALAVWQQKVNEEQARDGESEESVYALTFAQRMVTCLENALK